MAAGEDISPTSAAPTSAPRPRLRHAGLLGGLALALLDLAVYITYTLTARPFPCTAPRVSAHLLDCFWPDLGASIAALPWGYVALSLAVPFLAALLVAASGAPEAGAMRGAIIGSTVALLGTAFELLIVLGVVGYEIIAAAASPSASTCPPDTYCRSIALIPDFWQAVLVTVALIILGILYLRLVGGLALGALGAWIGKRLPHHARVPATPVP
jgi:hypothetical protein